MQYFRVVLLLKMARICPKKMHPKFTYSMTDMFGASEKVTAKLFPVDATDNYSC